ncbi:ankyrin repeat domain-containing protein [Rickettsiella endosymbiont of Dermanyssus gallinae]|uniref:ankyrin repeat domain-containing protein n=1 Tax=Rickettsiella endosymbiont of Dermanyssus gallinae TaxID=2856608 RepID=UPI001C528D6D|nr:ankyrin repeat domain-containing protein [Rickettsiella endosymbiont of Dermanyssus gallinae]
MLLEYGANVNLKAKFDITPIFDACELPSELLVEFFIKHGADVDIFDVSDRTVLFSAVENNEVDMVVDLINAGADAVIDVIDENGDAAIHRALTHPLADIRVLRELINAGANLDLQNKNGHTLLHLNVLSHKNEAAARLLLEKGADYSIEVNGVTALQDAAKSGFYPLIDWLIDEGVSVQANNGVLLEDCVEKFKIVLLENPTLFKLVALILGLNDKKDYLSNKWSLIQQELIKMQNTKIGLTEYSFYDILSERNPIKLKNIFSDQIVIDAINDNTLEAFPNFSMKIKSLKNNMKRIEGVRTPYSIYDIYTEKDKNKLANIFLNRNLENKVRELLNEADLGNVVRNNLWRNLQIGV